MEHDQRYGHDIPFVPHQGHWHETPGYHPHHHSSQPGYYVQGYAPSAGSYDSQHVETTPRQDQYQSFTYPSYPNMLTGAHNSYVAYQPSPPVHILPMTTSGPSSASETPPYPTRSSTQSATVQRKMLSDADRKRMCQYHADNPSKKQTEIGEIFGVERSTVSKVLRQKDKYLVSEEDGRKSPVKKPKGKFHELERALANWARKQEKEGIELTDEMIKTRATCFSHVARNGASIRESINDPHWIKEFKSRNKVGVARSRKNSVMKKESPAPLPTAPLPDSKDTGTTMSPPPVARWTSPTGDVFVSNDSPRLTNSATQVQRSTVYHSQSNNSLSSAYGGTATSSNTFSTINTNVNSPVQTPDTINAESMQGSGSYFSAGSHPNKFSSNSILVESPSLQSIQPSNILSSRPEANHWSNAYEQLSNSQLNNHNGGEILSHHGAHSMHSRRVHPQHSTSSLASHVSPPSVSSRRASNDEGHLHSSSQTQISYHNGPSLQTDSTTMERGSQAGQTPMSMQSPRSPSQNEAYAALGTVIDYLHNQPPNRFADSQDLAAMAKLSEKFRLAHQP